MSAELEAAQTRIAELIESIMAWRKMHQTQMERADKAEAERDEALFLSKQPRLQEVERIMKLEAERDAARADERFAYAECVGLQDAFAVERMAHLFGVIGWAGACQMRERQRANQESKTQVARNREDAARDYSDRTLEYVGNLVECIGKVEAERDAALAELAKANATEPA